MLHEALTVKDDKDEPFKYRQPKVGLRIFQNRTRTGLIYKTLTKLCCAYVKSQEMNKCQKKYKYVFKTNSSSNHFEKKNLESCFKFK